MYKCRKLMGKCTNLKVAHNQKVKKYVKVKESESSKYE